MPSFGARRFLEIRILGALSAASLSAVSCSAPISTIRSPAHPRVVELRNTSNIVRVLEIEPVAHQHLGASTTFTGHLHPGETKVLYLYDGITYHFRLVDETGRDGETRQDFRVAGDMELAYAGDSLVDRSPRVEVGSPVLIGPDGEAALDDRQLDDLFRRLGPLFTRGEAARWRALTAEGKRGLLAEFWNRLDPTPGTPENEFRTEVEARLAEIARRFTDGAEAGTDTPRGRIWLRYGKPDRILARTLPTELANPYEVWQYFSTGYTYVFLDERRSGRFGLLTSTDPNEPGRPDWRDRLPPGAAEEILGL